MRRDTEHEASLNSSDPQLMAFLGTSSAYLVNARGNSHLVPRTLTGTLAVKQQYLAYARKPAIPSFHDPPPFAGCVFVPALISSSTHAVEPSSVDHNAGDARPFRDTDAASCSYTTDLPKTSALLTHNRLERDN